LNSPFFINLLDEITSDERYYGEMAEAKKEFEKIAGQIMESDNSYNERINAFHNWYILDRPLNSTGKTPIQFYVESKSGSIPEDNLAGTKELIENHHSLFELVKLGKEDAVLKDLIQNKKIRVENADQLESLEKGDLFNSRLFQHGKLTYLSNYLILHPYSVYKLIRTEAKKVRKNGENAKPFLFRLLFFHSRWEQFTQMDVNNIYRFGAEFHGQKAV